MKGRVFLFWLAALLCIALPLSAAETSVETLLPQTCGPGWAAQGPVSTYDRANLYKYIDGEAELYLPYGFTRAATVMYTRPGEKDRGLVVNIFGMGSVLDAFGIYANYRSPDVPAVKVGAEGFAEESQLMFFQDRYFVQVMASGTLTQEQPVFLACAESVSGSLPKNTAMPGELALVRPPGVVPRTEKYFAEGLLGYAFLGKGLTAEATVAGSRAKAVVVLAGAKEGATRAFDGYVKYLNESKAAPKVEQGGKGRRLHAVDPLFRGVVFQEAGPWVIGFTGLKAPQDGDAAIDEWLKSLPKE